MKLLCHSLLVLAVLLPFSRLISQTTVPNKEKQAGDYSVPPNTGIPALLKDCRSTNIACSGTAGPAYLGTELPPEWTGFGNYGVAPTVQTYAYPNHLHFEDRRLGRDFHVVSNPGNFVDGLGILSRHTGNDPGLGFTNQDALGSYLFDAAPGSYSGYGTETTSTNLNLTSVIATKSIAHTIVSSAYHLGIGDFNQDAHYGHCWAGAINGDDELCKNFLYSMDEGGFDSAIPMARIQSTQPGATGTLLHTANGSLDHNRWWGAGRYAVLIRPDGQTDKPVFTLPITAVSAPSIASSPMRLGTLITSATIPSSALSAVWGYTAPYLVSPNNDVLQPVTTTITLDAASPSFITGLTPGIACMWGAYRTEHVQITKVTQPHSGIQTVTLLARYTPSGDPYRPASAYLFQDKPGEQGFCQTGGRIQSYDEGFGKPNQTVPLVGAIDAHTVVPSFNAKQGQHAMPVPIPLQVEVTLTRKANLVTLHSSTVEPRLFNDAPATLISSDDRTSTTAIFSNDSSQGTEVTDYHFLQPGTHPDLPEPIPATLIVGTPGANLMRVYPMAEIIATIDPDAANTALGDRLTTEPISFTYPAGSLIDSPAHYSGGFQLSSESFRTVQPGELLAGKTIEVRGPSLSDYFGTIVLANSTPPSTYRGLGGTATGPDGLHLTGIFTNIISLGPSQRFNNHNFDGNALASGSAFLNFPCATGSCTNPNAFFQLEQGDVNGAGWLRQLNQFTGTLTEGFTDAGYHFLSSLTFNRTRGLTINAPLALPLLGASTSPLCTTEGGLITNRNCTQPSPSAAQTGGLRATTSITLAPTTPIYDVTCPTTLFLTLPPAPSPWQHINIINTGHGTCTIAATPGIGNATLTPTVDLPSGAAGRYVFDGTAWRIE